MPTVMLSWNERKQLEESLARWMNWMHTTGKPGGQDPGWVAVQQGVYEKLKASLDDPGILAVEFTAFELRWASEGLMYQRSLVTYTQKEPQVGTFGVAVARYGPPERVHLGPLHRKMLKAAGVIDEHSNPEMLTDPPFQ